MLGLSVKAASAEVIRQSLDENKLLLDGKSAKLTQALKRFDRAVLACRDDTQLFELFFKIDDHEGADLKKIDDSTIKTAIKAAKPKGTFSRREAIFARKRYRDIFGPIIENPFSCNAHVGWVTRKEWDGYEKLELWTHDWRVEYVFNGATYSQTGCAVAEKRCWRDIGRFVRQLAKTHKGATIRLARGVDRKTKRGHDFTRRARTAFEKAAARD